MLASAGRSPQRGPVCRRCKKHVPQFEELSRADEARIRELIAQERPGTAMQELKAATGCPTRWAKIWVIHRGQPNEFDGPPCPHCGKALASPRAKQCLACGADWHGAR
jgi:hypothetical protein